jgi:hypothetical protein
MSYVIADENDEAMHWGAAVDNGDGSYDPHIVLTISLGQQHILTHKLPVRATTWEALAVADMLRTLADDIENNVKSIRARQRALAAAGVQNFSFIKEDVT